jgi:hypothetical protein
MYTGRAYGWTSPFREASCMHITKTLPLNSKTTFEMRKNTFEVFQNISNVISALCGVLKTI